MKKFLLTAILIWAVYVGALAADWPAAMELGGFTITNIVGETKPDGSGKASGRLMVPTDGTCPIDLTKTSSDSIMGTMRSGFTYGGLRIDGSFILDRRGLEGTGTVRTSVRPIQDANIRFDAKTGITGSGRVYLGQRFAVPVRFDIKPTGLSSLNGMASRQVSADTPLAVYTFKGDVTVSAVGTGIKTAARGMIERRGKIGGMTSSFGPLAFDVDVTTGEASVNVGGTELVLDLW